MTSSKEGKFLKIFFMEETHCLASITVCISAKKLTLPKKPASK